MSEVKKEYPPIHCKTQGLKYEFPEDDWFTFNNQKLDFNLWIGNDDKKYLTVYPVKVSDDGLHETDGNIIIATYRLELIDTSKG